MTLTLVLLGGCATTTGDFCDVASAIRPSKHDGMTEGTQKQVLAHNTYGARYCGWKP
jgi:hypothetical protein